MALLLLALPLYAQGDTELERRSAEDIRQTVIVGEPLSLQRPAGGPFFAILTPAAEVRGAPAAEVRGAPAAKPRGGVVLVHGLGAHPDWGLISTLRTQLPAAGYTTLSIQMPLLPENSRPEDYAAVFPDAVTRLRAAVAFLRASGLEKVAVVSYDLGGRMVNHFLVREAQPGVNAWASIAISGGVFTDAARLRLPVLDLYAERDYPPLVQNAEKRAGDIRLLRGSAQVEVAGANHLFDGREAQMVGHVRTWLDRVFR
ncbi:MAG: alpha/beta fold hydrolase [Burkholderiales bacterium]